MNFFNLGPMELVLIGVIALIAVGPRKLPELGRMVGRWMKVVREASDEMKRGLYFDDEIKRPLPPPRPKQVAPIPHQPPHDCEPADIIDATLVSEESLQKDGEASEEASRSQEGDFGQGDSSETLTTVDAQPVQTDKRRQEEPED